MHELRTTATLVELSTLDEASRLDATLDRDELEALLAGGDTPRLWFDVGVEGEPEPQRLTVGISDEDLRALLADTGDAEVALAIDGAALANLFEEPEVEGHGMRSALAIAAAAAATAIAAPAAMGATPQAVGAAAKQQGVGAAATTQVSSQVVRSAIQRGASKSSVARSSALSFAKLRILRAGAVR